MLAWSAERRCDLERWYSAGPVPLSQLGGERGTECCGHLVGTSPGRKLGALPHTGQPPTAKSCPAPSASLWRLRSLSRRRRARREVFPSAAVLPGATPGGASQDSAWREGLRSPWRHCQPLLEFSLPASLSVSLVSVAPAPKTSGAVSCVTPQEGKAVSVPPLTRRCSLPCRHTEKMLHSMG